MRLGELLSNPNRFDGILFLVQNLCAIVCNHEIMEMWRQLDGDRARVARVALIAAAGSEREIGNT